MKIKITLISLLIYSSIFSQNDAEIDNTFNSQSGFTRVVLNIAIQNDNKILVAGKNNISSTGGKLVRLNTDGSLDTSFSTEGFTNGYPNIIDGNINTTLIQQDGKILVGGNFNNFNGNSARQIIRLNQNGTTDNSFNGSFIGNNEKVYSFAIDSNNKILVGGSFNTYRTTTSKNLIRLNNDGTIDRTFNIDGYSNNTKVTSITIQEDNKILIGGSFTSYDGVEANSIIRLNSDGTIDNTFIYGSGFKKNLDGLNVNVSSITIKNNKILIGGAFTEYNGILANNLIRLNNNGSIDNTFSYGSGFNLPVSTIHIQNDGKILCGGDFTSYKGQNSNRIIRINENGTVDNTFIIGSGLNNKLNSIKIDYNGHIVLGGEFSQYNSNSIDYVTRLNGNITLNVAEYLSSDFEIYPNPTNKFINIKNKNGENIEKIEIFNSLGKLIKPNDINNSYLDVTDLKKGIYFFRIKTENGIVTKKIIKK